MPLLNDTLTPRNIINANPSTKRVIYVNPFDRARELRERAMLAAWQKVIPFETPLPLTDELKARWWEEFRRRWTLDNEFAAVGIRPQDRARAIELLGQKVKAERPATRGYCWCPYCWNRFRHKDVEYHMDGCPRRVFMGRQPDFESTRSTPHTAR